ncbi:MAG: methyltransferase domain-containing protein [Gammaproteobacteria bacterium]|nr:methyltransferase domain-containing protein [Gammaproteobacteria bacterium]MDP2346435.1 methyltransferase domain-containing protein [Gammaproteobacteria bacterium]
MKRITALLALLAATLTTSTQAIDVAALNAALANDARPAADREADARRKPAETLDFFGVERGMTVVDLIAAGGYYTEVLATAVGPGGKVYMQNSPASLTGERGANTERAINDRLAGGRLANVERLNRDPHDLGLPANSLDAAVIALEYHEFYRAADPQTEANFLNEMKRVLKSGGILGIVDHAGNAGNDNGPMHRAELEKVLAGATAAGFIIDGTSDLLANPADNRSLTVFDASIRGVTDQFIVKLRKP